MFLLGLSSVLFILLTEIKNTLEGINRISEAEEQISELEDKMVEITSEEENKVKK